MVATPVANLDEVIIAHQKDMAKTNMIPSRPETFSGLEGRRSIFFSDLNSTIILRSMELHAARHLISVVLPIALVLGAMQAMLDAGALIAVDGTRIPAPIGVARQFCLDACSIA